MKKQIILGVIGGVVVVALIVVVILMVRLDTIVKSTVEREGTSQLQLATTLDGADVGILGGTLTLDDLAIANPDGYSAPHIFQLGQVNVGVSYRELMGQPVRVRTININSPKLVIERSGEGLRELGRINLREMLARLQTSEGEGQTKLLINEINVTGTQVVIRPNIQGLAPEYVVRIPDVTLTEVGTADEAQNGAEIGRVATEVAMALARRAADSSELPEELRALLAGDLESIIEQYKGKLSQELHKRLEAELSELQGKLGSDVSEAADRLLKGDAREVGERAREEVERGIGELLGRRRSDEPTTRPSDR